jgi:hypothetical protein
MITQSERELLRQDFTGSTIWHGPSTGEPGFKLSRMRIQGSPSNAHGINRSGKSRIRKLNPRASPRPSSWLSRSARFILGR